MALLAMALLHTLHIENKIISDKEIKLSKIQTECEMFCTLISKSNFQTN